MRIPIFWRLTLGYLAILFLSIGVSSYSIVQLGGLSGTARTALDTDNRMIAYEEKLTDAFLSEVRYAGRFLITRAGALHDQYRQFKNDFQRYMSEIKSLAASDEIKARLSRVEEMHLRYHDLFDQEVRYIKAGQPYAESRYQQEKEKVLESALRELERLKAQLHNSLHDRLETMERVARTARSIATVTTLVLIALGVALSFLISKSITMPLAALRRRTSAEAEEAADVASDVSRIPEIQELADALSKARTKLRESAKTNAAFVHTVTERFATPLISLKKRLSYLNEELSETISAEQRKTFEILAQETERLIQGCAGLQLPSGVQAEANDRQERWAPRGVKFRDSWRRSIYWTRDWRGFRSRLESALKAIAERARGVAGGSWNAIFDSIKTLGYGKVKKQ